MQILWKNLRKTGRASSACFDASSRCGTGCLQKWRPVSISEFLIENRFVENFDEYCYNQKNNERSVVGNFRIRSDSISKHWEDIDSDNEWEIDENNFKDLENKKETEESKDTERRH